MQPESKLRGWLVRGESPIPASHKLDRSLSGLNESSQPHFRISRYWKAPAFLITPALLNRPATPRGVTGYVDPHD
ncbi:hypothetical protein [Stutzerimonas stutzeri]|uniref:hypothetical protein n=1 Tax=Stutzerimonas stutzeri TaxID=316 RepID=UPI00371577DA